MAHTVVNRGSRHESSRELSTTERLKKIWIEEGIRLGAQLAFQMGIQLGVRQNQLITILSLSRRAFTPQQVADTLSLDLGEVERVLT